MTRDCNLNCKYCFMLEKNKFKGELIDFDLLKKIIDRIATQRIINNMTNQLLQIVLHGGEALLLGNKKLYEILEYMTVKFNKHGIEFTLACQTNGTLLTDEMMKILSKFEVNLYDVKDHLVQALQS